MESKEKDKCYLERRRVLHDLLETHSDNSLLLLKADGDIMDNEIFFNIQRRSKQYDWNINFNPLIEAGFMPHRIDGHMGKDTLMLRCRLAKEIKADEA